MAQSKSNAASSQCVAPADAASHDLLDQSIAMRAMRGDIQAARIIKGNADRGARTPLELGPLETADDLQRAQTEILRSAARGAISASEAKKLGEQIEFLGRAIERAETARKIDALRDQVNASRKNLTRQSIEREAKLLTVDVLNYVKKEEMEWDEYLKCYGPNAIQHLLTVSALSYLYLVSGMSMSDFFELGGRNHLPRSMQDIHDLCDIYDPKEGKPRREKRVFYPKYYPPDRWMPHGWKCTCEGVETLWVETDLKVPDFFQIYCDRCFKLAGWGTESEFHDAHKKGLSAWVERSEVETISKLMPPPVIGVSAYLKEKKIHAVIDYPDGEDQAPDIQFYVQSEKD